MKPDSWDTSVILPKDPGEGWLGFNIITYKVFVAGNPISWKWKKQWLNFYTTCERTNLSVVLIPHVDSVDGSDWNSDYCYMLRKRTNEFVTGCDRNSNESCSTYDECNTD